MKHHAQRHDSTVRVSHRESRKQRSRPYPLSVSRPHKLGDRKVFVALTTKCRAVEARVTRVRLAERTSHCRDAAARFWLRSCHHSALPLVPFVHIASDSTKLAGITGAWPF